MEIAARKNRMNYLVDGQWFKKKRLFYFTDVNPAASELLQGKCEEESGFKEVNKESKLPVSRLNFDICVDVFEV